MLISIILLTFLSPGAVISLLYLQYIFSYSFLFRHFLSHSKLIGGIGIGFRIVISSSPFSNYFTLFLCCNYILPQVLIGIFRHLCLKKTHRSFSYVFQSPQSGFFHFYGTLWKPACSKGSETCFCR